MVAESLSVEEQLDFLLNWEKKGCNVAGLLDVRDLSKFNELHLSNSTYYDYTAKSARELPPRGASFVVFGDEEETLNNALEELIRLGYEIIKGFLISNEIFKRFDKEFLASGFHSQRVLWKPSPCLGKYISEVENILYQTFEKEKLRAFDIACGTGRDVVFLALKGWEVYGVDYTEIHLNYAQDFANRHSVTDKVNLINKDIEEEGITENFGKFHLINVARYLHRPLFPTFAELLEKGGVIIYHTFMKGCENTEVGRPKSPKFLLNEGELRSIFESYGNFTIIHDEIYVLSDGRPTSLFVARKNL